MDSLDCTKRRIKSVIAGSGVPEDPIHAQNTLDWLLKLDPKADQALRIAALGHDIERALEHRKVFRANFANFEAFKAAHAENSALILQEIMADCGLEPDLAAEVCRLVRLHEVGGDPRADLLRDADSISFFDVNLPFYSERNGLTETLRRSIWGYRRLSERAKNMVAGLGIDAIRCCKLALDRD